MLFNSLMVKYKAIAVVSTNAKNGSFYASALIAELRSEESRGSGSRWLIFVNLTVRNRHSMRSEESRGSAFISNIFTVRRAEKRKA